MSTSGPAPQTEKPADWRARLRGSRFGTLAVLVVTTALVLVGAYLIDRPDPGASTTDSDVTAVELMGEQSGPPPKVGEPAQDFTAMTVDGQEVSLSQFKGRPVWLTFGASWCASCRAEFPDVQTVHSQSGDDGPVVLSVYLSEGTSTVRDFTQRTGLTFTHIPDPQTRLASMYRVMGVPTHYFIDTAGVLRSVEIGALPKDRMDAHLAELTP